MVAYRVSQSKKSYHLIFDFICLKWAFLLINDEEIQYLY